MPCKRFAKPRSKGAQIVCLQELFRSQYFCREEDARLFDLAETIPGPSTEMLCPLAAELGVVIVASLFEKRATGPVSQHGGDHRCRWHAARASIARCTSRTIRCFSRNSTSRPGDLGFRTFDTKFGRIATLVCWDQWYPEAARLAALTGANILFYPTAIGWHPAEKAEYGAAQHDAWRTIQRAHAIANGIYVAAVNRVGFEGPPENGLEFWGASFVSDPFGRILAEASHDKEEILIVECDPKQMEEVRRNWPFLRDRRIDAYGPITSGFSLETPDAARARVPHAGRVGTARSHLDRLAAQRRRLAGAFRADSVGLRRDRAQAVAGGARAHPGAG